MPAKRTIAIRWIALALLGWALLAPSLHLEHDDHAEVCPYCHPASGVSFDVPPVTAAPGSCLRAAAPAFDADSGRRTEPHPISGPRAPPTAD